MKKSTKFDTLSTLFINSCKKFKNPERFLQYKQFVLVTELSQSIDKITGWEIFKYS